MNIEINSETVVVEKLSRATIRVQEVDQCTNTVLRLHLSSSSLHLTLMGAKSRSCSLLRPGEVWSEAIQLCANVAGEHYITARLTYYDHKHLQQKVEKRLFLNAQSIEPIAVVDQLHERRSGGAKTFSHLDSRAFHACLMEAYRRDDFEQMLYYGLDKQLDRLASNSNFDRTVFEVIGVARREDWIFDLVEAAYEANPNKKCLAELRQKFFERP